MKVRWADDLSEVRLFESSASDAACRTEIWYQEEDYASFKASGRMVAKEWRGMGYSFLLKDTFEEPDIDTCQVYLNAFAQQEESLCRRGLERHLSRQHGEERTDLKVRARHAVLSQQRRARRYGKATYLEYAEQIAKSYREASVEAYDFAQRIALADAHCILHGDDNSVADEILASFTAHRRDHLPGDMEAFARRMSNMSTESNGSIMSGTSFDSRRGWAEATSRPRITLNDYSFMGGIIDLPSGVSSGDRGKHCDSRTESIPRGARSTRNPNRRLSGSSSQHVEDIYAAIA
jgi:hypothetical protein